MFAKELVTKLQNYFASQPSGVKPRASSRRVVDMIPGARDALVLDSAKYKQLMLSVEGKQETCCVKIACQSRKFRSAILTFRGRVLGCVFGSKRTSEQLFGKQAYDQMLAEMAPDSTIEASPLDESLVLAAGSLFHSQPVNPPPNHPVLSTFNSTYNQLVQSSKPGSIVIIDEARFPVVTVYLFNGQVVGVFSHSTGWLSSSYEAALQCLRRVENATIFASQLTARDVQDVLPLTFGLSRLGAVQASSVSHAQSKKLDGLLVKIKPVDRKVISSAARFFPGGAQSSNTSRFKELW